MRQPVDEVTNVPSFAAPRGKDNCIAPWRGNARALAATLMERGVDVVSGGTDTPLALIDLTCNKNGVPGDPRPPTVTSGLRFGVSAGTTRGFRTANFETIGNLIGDVLDGLGGGAGDMGVLERRVLGKVSAMTRDFPIYEKG